MNCIFYGCKSLIIFPDVSKWNINKDKKKSIDSLFEESSSNNKCSSENEILNSESNISENNSDNNHNELNININNIMTNNELNLDLNYDLNNYYDNFYN